jgi:hypothetical protein
MGAPLGLAGLHRQKRLGSIERLNLALFIDAEHHGAFGRREIQTDDVPYLLDKQRVGRKFEGLRTMRLQAKRLPNPMDRGRRMAHRLRHGPPAPMRRPLRECLQSLVDRGSNLVVTNLARRAGTWLIVQPAHAIAGEPIAPHAGCVGADIQLRRDFLVSPLAAASTIRARTASDCGAPCLRIRAVNAAFSASSSTIATARPFAIPASLFKVRLECNSAFINQRQHFL